MKKTNSEFKITPSVQADLKAFREREGIAQARLAKMLNTNPSYLSRYLNASADEVLNFKPASLEAAAEDVIAGYERRAVLSAEFLFETPVYRQFKYACERAQRVGFISLVSGRAGWGKTSAIQLFCASHPSAVPVTLNRRHRNDSGVEKLLFEASAGRRRWSGNTSRWDFLVDRYKGSGRLLIFDNAHRMTSSGRQWAMDFFDSTECPQVLVANPQIVEAMNNDALFDDGQQASRLGYHREVKIKRADLEAIVPRIVEQFDPKWLKSDDFLDLLLRVAEGPGHLRAVKIHLRSMRDTIARSKKRLSPVDALIAANQTVISPVDLLDAIERGTEVAA